MKPTKIFICLFLGTLTTLVALCCTISAILDFGTY